MNQHQTTLLLEQLCVNIAKQIEQSWLPDTRQAQMIQRAIELTARQVKLGEME